MTGHEFGVITISLAEPTILREKHFESRWASICVTNDEGKVAREAKLPSEPDVFGLFLTE
jgi:hypothetical protein